jgi:hypothetical protein
MDIMKAGIDGENSLSISHRTTLPRGKQHMTPRRLGHKSRPISGEKKETEGEQFVHLPFYRRSVRRSTSR